MAEFLEELKSDEWEVETPSGWQSFSGIGKTIKYTVWVVKTTNHELKCADDHKVYSWNKNTGGAITETFVKDLVVGNYLLCKDGFDEIISITETDEAEEMYDLLDVENGNIYYTNDILSHNSTTVTSYILHYVLFNQNMSVAMLANKQSTAKDLLSRLKQSYEYLPRWLQQGIKEWNKYSIVLENGSKVMASATSSSAIRGGSYNALLIDEFAHVPTNVAEEFFSSVYPTITSGQSTRVIMISTPKGLNMFYHFWKGAQSKQNEYVPIEVKWDQVPKYPGGPLRDEEWKRETIRNSSERQFQEEFESLEYHTRIHIDGDKDITIGQLYDELKETNIPKNNIK